MNINRKVVWAEGVFLGQQHFQQWDLFLREQHKLMHKYQLDMAFGICQLSVDESELDAALFN